ncbi:GNAT family protein [Streptomyces sp. NPDC050698]
MTTYWPLTGLRLRTGSVELRVPNPAECEALADAAAREPHTHPLIPFLGVATDTPAQRGRRTLQWLWGNAGTWQPDEWSLALAVFDRDQLVGVQNVRAQAFARTREARTGMWIFPDRRGQGLGTHSRRALLHLIFDGLGAHRVLHRTAADNHPALAHVRSIGCQEEPGADDATTRHFSLTADHWHTLTQPMPVHCTGLERALFMFGLGPE